MSGIVPTRCERRLDCGAGAARVAGAAPRPAVSSARRGPARRSPGRSLRATPTAVDHRDGPDRSRRATALGDQRCSRINRHTSSHSHGRSLDPRCFGRRACSIGPLLGTERPIRRPAAVGRRISRHTVDIENVGDQIARERASGPRRPATDRCGAIEYAEYLARRVEGDVSNTVTLPFIDFQIPLNVVILGVLAGLTYALIAIGLTLVYRTSHVLNFAAGEMGALPALLIPILVINKGWPYWLALALTLLGAATIGGLTEALVMRPLSRGPRLTTLVATIALAQALFGFSLLIPRGGDLTGKPFPTPFHWHLTVGTLRLGPGQILILIVAPLCALGVTLFLRHTSLGRASRAAAENTEAARLAGVPTVAGVVRDLGDRRPPRRHRGDPHRWHPPAHAVHGARTDHPPAGPRGGDAGRAQQHLGIVRRRDRHRRVRGAGALELPHRRRARDGAGGGDPRQHADPARAGPGPPGAPGQRPDADERRAAAAGVAGAAPRRAPGQGRSARADADARHPRPLRRAAVVAGGADDDRADRPHRAVARGADRVRRPRVARSVRASSPSARRSAGGCTSSATRTSRSGRSSSSPGRAWR